MRVRVCVLDGDGSIQGWIVAFVVMVCRVGLMIGIYGSFDRFSFRGCVWYGRVRFSGKRCGKGSDL